MPLPPASPARRWAEALLDLVYPRRCGGCHRLGTWLCPTCLDGIEPPAPLGWICGRCGAVLRDLPDLPICPRGCTAPDLTGVLAAGAYAGPLRESIHRFKYDRWRVLGTPLAALLEATSAATPLPWSAESLPYLVPVPLHPLRLRERGFNQSAVLAAGLSRRLGWPVLQGLVRVRHTPHQVGLTAAERATNLEEAFAWRAGAPPPPAPLLLIDDVYTTGVTMGACAEALRMAGATAIYGLVLARAGDAGAAAVA